MYTSPELSKVVTCLTAAIVTSGYCFGNLQRKYTLQMQEAVAASNEVILMKFFHFRWHLLLLSYAVLYILQ